MESQEIARRTEKVQNRIEDLKKELAAGLPPKPTRSPDQIQSDIAWWSGVVRVLSQYTRPNAAPGLGGREVPSRSWEPHLSSPEKRKEKATQAGTRLIELRKELADARAAGPQPKAPVEPRVHGEWEPRVFDANVVTPSLVGLEKALKQGWEKAVEAVADIEQQFKFKHSLSDIMRKKEQGLTLTDSRVHDFIEAMKKLVLQHFMKESDTRKLIEMYNVYKDNWDTDRDASLVTLRTRLVDKIKNSIKMGPTEVAEKPKKTKSKSKSGPKVEVPMTDSQRILQERAKAREQAMAPA
jgi:hypothetical protein